MEDIDGRLLRPRSDTLPGGDDIRRLVDLAEAEVDPLKNDTVGLTIVTERGAFGSDMLPEFSDYRLSADEIRRIARTIVVDRMGNAATDRLFRTLDEVERLKTAAELLEATRAA